MWERMEKKHFAHIALNNPAFHPTVEHRFSKLATFAANWVLLPKIYTVALVNTHVTAKSTCGFLSIITQSVVYETNSFTEITQHEFKL